MIDENVRELLVYGLKNGLVDRTDATYTANRLLECLGLDAAPAVEGVLCEGFPEAEPEGRPLADILNDILDYAFEKKLIPDNSVTQRDLFDTRIMGILTPPPSEVIRRFEALYEKSPAAATDAYYEFSQNTNYIRRDRIAKDVRWKADTQYGALDITINLSKPEKDPRAIAAAGSSASVKYPKCQLCRENEGYAGRLDHPARQNHRIIPVTINGQPWGFQYSPYVYYNEHCIVFNFKHTPMKICHETFVKLFDFVKLFPHYFLGSNADLPIVGGSILSHDHFQGGHYTFAMASAPVEHEFSLPDFPDVKAGVVKWPMSVIRVRCSDEKRVIAFADCVLGAWRGYSDESAFIYAQTDKTPHNTITPIARKAGGLYELDLVLRNNITTDEHPLGVFHPHQELHHIKKENIGLIEVMGLAVLPSRLKSEMELLKKAILEGRSLREDEVLAKHADWAEDFIRAHERVDASNIDGIIKEEIGKVFMRVLECAGVFKRDESGREAFGRFISYLQAYEPLHKEEFC